MLVNEQPSPSSDQTLPSMYDDSDTSTISGKTFLTWQSLISRVITKDPDANRSPINSTPLPGIKSTRLPSVPMLPHVVEVRSNVHVIPNSPDLTGTLSLDSVPLSLHSRSPKTRMLISHPEYAYQLSSYITSFKSLRRYWECLRSWGSPWSSLPVTIRYTLEPFMTQHPHSVLPYAILYEYMNVYVMRVMCNVIKISLKSYGFIYHYLGYQEY